MPISPAFSVTQSAITPASVTINDDSTGSYGTITQRRIYIQDAYGSYLTGNDVVNYDAWALADLSYTYSALQHDAAVNIKVEWLDVSNNIINTLNNNYALPEFGKQFFYYLVQLQGLTPGVYQDLSYKGNLATFWALISGGINAIVYGNDLAAAQNCFNIETEMRLKQSYFF